MRTRLRSMQDKTSLIIFRAMWHYTVVAPRSHLFSSPSVWQRLPVKEQSGCDVFVDKWFTQAVYCGKVTTAGTTLWRSTRLIVSQNNQPLIRERDDKKKTSDTIYRISKFSQVQLDLLDPGGWSEPDFIHISVFSQKKISAKTQTKAKLHTCACDSR